MNELFTDNPSSVWHAGERVLQASIGATERMEDLGRRFVRPFLLDQHREFYAQLPFAVLGTVDPGGAPWATLITGRPGFLSAPTPDALGIDITPDAADPAAAGIGPGLPVGLLGIELHTRRRNRMNGQLRKRSDGGLEIAVEQSYGNCPQFIQLRNFRFVEEPQASSASHVEEVGGLDAAARDMIRAADTFFVASYADGETRQVDVSHRGGKPGFVRVAEDGTLTIPDFAGNQFFNTLGNILLNGKAGLTFVDFASGDLLQLTGDAEIVLEGPEIAAFEGAERLWRFVPRRVVRRAGALPLRWETDPEGQSPRSAQTGDWQAVAARLEESANRAKWRPFRVVGIVDESTIIRSFHLEPDDGFPAVSFKPGQHLPIRVITPGQNRLVIRTYTITSAPGGAGYRISVKHDGLVSQFLHDQVRVGDRIEVGRPAGAFTFDPQAKRPAVLLAAGVGITPLLAMLGQAVRDGNGAGGVRPATLFYSARTLKERAFDRELADLSREAQGAVRIVRILSDMADAVASQDFDVLGRLDLAVLARHLPFGSHDFYICGPAGYTQALYDALLTADVPDERIFAETFGPSVLVRSISADKGNDRSQPAASEIEVEFAVSGKRATWRPETGSLLDLAEQAGLQPEFSCRSGSCGTCRTAVLAGSVVHPPGTVAGSAPDDALICCAVPAKPAVDTPAKLRLAL
jgi:ferredoxin-NADP reductase/predicted pyridoxine 5'-phosphate oxidase superfamily flavin-nucleotide-binding protein